PEPPPQPRRRGAPQAASPAAPRPAATAPQSVLPVPADPPSSMSPLSLNCVIAESGNWRIEERAACTPNSAISQLLLHSSFSLRQCPRPGRRQTYSPLRPG